jgi:phosphatidylethanolamine/phosphatidyl-N-methylethanolamine N-methyltransferase
MYSSRLDKKITDKLRKDYNIECYSGPASYLFSKSHKLMEKNIPNKKFNDILEIGAGAHPHIKYISHKFKNYYCCENSKFTINYLKKKYPSIKTIYVKNDIIQTNKKFDRIILSHSLEHIYKPEALLLKLYSLLKKNGIISIAIPTDPAILYRFMRYFKKKIFSKYKISEIEYDYINSIEHINSYFNNDTIIKYLFKNYKKYYYPFNFLSADLNIFSFYQIIKK